MLGVATASIALALLIGGSLWAPPGPDETLERLEIRDWIVVCRPGTPGAGFPPPNPRCVMEQRGEKDGYELLVRAGWLSADGEPAMLVSVSPILPEGEGILVKVDGKARAAPAVDRCDGDRCLAYLRLDETVLPAFVRGRRAVFSFPDSEGRLIEVPISLLGFTKAYLTQRRG